MCSCRCWLRGVPSLCSPTLWVDCRSYLLQWEYRYGSNVLSWEVGKYPFSGHDCMISCSLQQNGSVFLATLRCVTWLRTLPGVFISTGIYMTRHKGMNLDFLSIPRGFTAVLYMGKFEIQTVACYWPSHLEAALVPCAPVESLLSCVCSVWLLHFSLRGCIRDLIDRVTLNSSLLKAEQGWLFSGRCSKEVQRTLGCYGVCLVPILWYFLHPARSGFAQASPRLLLGYSPKHWDAWHEG